MSRAFCLLLLTACPAATTAPVTPPIERAAVAVMVGAPLRLLTGGTPVDRSAAFEVRAGNPTDTPLHLAVAVVDAEAHWHWVLTETRLEPRRPAAPLINATPLEALPAGRATLYRFISTSALDLEQLETLTLEQARARYPELMMGFTPFTTR